MSSITEHMANSIAGAINLEEDLLIHIKHQLEHNGFNVWLMRNFASDLANVAVELHYTLDLNYSDIRSTIIYTLNSYTISYGLRREEEIDINKLRIFYEEYLLIGNMDI